MKELSRTQKVLSGILKAAVILSAAVGITISALAGRDHFMGGNTVFMYFTVQSNIAVAVIGAIGCVMMLCNIKPGKVWQIIKFVGTVAITLTGVVFCFVLAPTFAEHAWNLQNILTHVVVPIASVIDFFVVSSTFKIEKKSVIYVTVPPLLYAIYAGIGYALDWNFGAGMNYPYFFLNWGSPAGAFGFTNELPFMGTAWWILLLLVFLMVVGLCYLFIADLFGKEKKK